eukprot:2180310-Rhodomonas_salina.1
MARPTSHTQTELSSRSCAASGLRPRAETDFRAASVMASVDAGLTSTTHLACPWRNSVTAPS